MNETNMGDFICRLRKEKSMTQKELAQSLGVTDKAVSKWERGLSLPDISLLTSIADILEINTSELLKGERLNSAVHEEMETTVKKALVYSEKKTRRNWQRFCDICAILLTASFTLAAITCIICEIAVSHRLSWSWIVIASLAYSWVIIMPLLKCDTKKIRWSLLSTIIGIFPLLFIIGNIVGDSRVYTMGGIISLMSAIALWLIYLTFVYLHNYLFAAYGIACLIFIPLQIGINTVVTRFTNEIQSSPTQTAINVVASTGAALLFFLFEYILKSTKRLKEKKRETSEL